MEKENKIDSTEIIRLEVKEGTISVVCEASASRKTGINQRKESEKSTLSIETVDNTKNASSWNESSYTGTDSKESERQDTNTDIGSRKAESRNQSFTVESTSIQGSDTTSILGTGDEEESRSRKSKSLNSSRDKPVEIDSSLTKESMINGKQDSKETSESGNSCLKTLDKNEENKTKDGDEQQENLARKDSYDVKNKNDESGNTANQGSVKELDDNDGGLESRPEKRRKCAAKVTGDDSTSPALQEVCSEDIDAEWNLDEEQRLLDALDSDAGRRYWNTIANQVKTKNVEQIKHFTEKLRAEANGLTPVYLMGEKDDPLKGWINVCERLRRGTEDIDAKCIPQVMTIAAVEPTPSSEEDINGPNYARIYTFLSSILRGQTTVELTPIDARVVLELIQNLEMKLMNADLLEQQGFLRSRYTGITKDLEKEQIVLAMEALQEKMIYDADKETGDVDMRQTHSFEGNGSSSHRSRETTERVVDTQHYQGGKTPDTFMSSSSNGAGKSSLEIIPEKAHISMDIQTDKRSETSEPLLFTVKIPNLEQVKISNLEETKPEKTETLMDIQTGKSPKTSETLTSDTATISDSGETKMSNLDEIRTNQANKEKVPDVHNGRRTEVPEPLPTNATTVADLEGGKISNSNEIRTEEPLKDSHTVTQEASESLPPQNATVSDTKEANNDKTDNETDKKQESSWWNLTLLAPKSDHMKTDETNTSDHQPPSTNSKTGEIPESSNSIKCLQNSATPGSTQTRSKQKSMPPPDESTRSKTEARKLKIERLKKGLKKPKLSSLNPVCVPVTMLNVKPKAHQSL